jgi:hypothetical protein
MAGKNVRKYLEARGLDAFYDLYHVLGETILSTAKNLTGYIELIRGLERDNPNFFADADACVVRSKDALRSTQHFF